MPDHIDPGTAALFALIAVALVSLGAILTGSTDQFSIAERGTVLGGIVAVLAGIAYFGRRKRNGGEWMATLNTAILLNAYGADPAASRTPTPTFQITGDGGAATYRCAIDGADIGEFRTSDVWGRINVFVAAPVADGKHTFTFEEIAPRPGGPAGFPCVPYPFSVDTRPSTPPVIASVMPNPPSADGRQSLVVRGTITAGEDTRSVRLYSGMLGIGGAGISGTGWYAATMPLAVGNHRIEAIAADPAGNVSPRSDAWPITIGTPTETPKPTVPLVVGAVSGKVPQVMLSWGAPGDGGSVITGYRVYRSGTAIATVTVTAYTDSAPLRGAAYTVAAINAIGEGPQSPAVVAWT